MHIGRESELGHKDRELHHPRKRQRKKNHTEETEKRGPIKAGGNPEEFCIPEAKGRGFQKRTWPTVSNVAKISKLRMDLSGKANTQVFFSRLPCSKDLNLNEISPYRSIYLRKSESEIEQSFWSFGCFHVSMPTDDAFMEAAIQLYFQRAHWPITS